jgi:hypothetical protein
MFSLEDRRLLLKLQILSWGFQQVLIKNVKFFPIILFVPMYRFTFPVIKNQVLILDPDTAP